MKRAGVGIVVMIAVGIWAQSVWAIGMQPSIINQEMTRVRYSAAAYQAFSLAATSDSGGKITEAPLTPKYRSPGKAFALSLVVPGLGQWYYGSKVKAIGFAGIEAALWVFHFKYHSEGNKATTEFEEYNRTHWLPDNYKTYLERAYNGATDDDQLDTIQEISHHLPDTYTGQYYEMTGKYDQFAWGWDDASFGGFTLAGDYVPPRITSSALTPSSAHRDYYENLRHDANNKFDKARAMVFAVLVNHVVSAFEAFITTKRHNHGPEKSKDDAFSSRIDVSAKFKSIYSRNDTPYVKVTLKLK